MTDVLIAVFGLLALLFALLVLTARQPMRAALALVAHMISLAAIYACLQAYVVALFQVLIYVGAVMVFMVYTIMLLDDRDLAYRSRYARLAVPALAATALAAAALLRLVWQAPAAAEQGGASFTFAAFSVEFIRHYWFHFELATVLLLVGIVAAWTAIREGR